MVDFVCVLALVKLAVQKGLARERLIFQHFDALPTTCVVLGFFCHCKQLTHLVLHIGIITIIITELSSACISWNLTSSTVNGITTRLPKEKEKNGSAQTC